MIRSFAYGVYLKCWLKYNLLKMHPTQIAEQFKTKVLAFALSPDAVRETTLFCLDKEENVPALITVLDLLRSDQTLVRYYDSFFEAQMSSYMIARDYNRILLEVTAYEEIHDETQVTLSAKITALSALDFEGNETQINELMTRSLS